MNIRPDVGLTFDDVLIVPKYSAIRSRNDVNTSGLLAKGIRLQLPILSANMDTVTEAAMAIAMAEQGGIGILHRFMSIERQAEQVLRVKRAESLVVNNPLKIGPQASIDEARLVMRHQDVGGLMVVDYENHLIGVITTRDMLLARDGKAAVSSVMTPRDRLIVAGPTEAVDDAQEKLHQARVEKLPLVDEENHLVGLITMQDIVKLKEHPFATKDELGRLRVGVAIGVRSEDIERAAACIEAGADVLVVDIAHGHSDHTVRMVKRLKKNFPNVPVVAGNVATGDGVRELADAGAELDQSRRRRRLDLYHPHRLRLRCASIDRRGRCGRGGPQTGYADHFRRWRAHLGRPDQSPGRRRQHGHAGLYAGRHR